MDSCPPSQSFRMQLQRMFHKTPFGYRRLWKSGFNLRTSRTSPTTANIASGFLRLPLEIRQQIYHYLLAQDFQSRAINITVRQRRYGGYKLHGLESIKGLVFVSRTFHDELLTYCFSRFNFFLHNDAESIRFVVREFYRQIGLENRKLVRYITIPNFSINRVLLHPLNMVALFVSSQARYLQLLDDTQRAFTFLEHFPALEELDLGLDSIEATPSSAGRSPYADSSRPYIRIALQDARRLPTRVTVGIWWMSGYGARRLGTDGETAEAQNSFLLHQIGEELAPIRVVCKGLM